MIKDPLLHIHHILKSIAKIDDTVSKNSLDRLTHEDVIYDGVLRNLQTMAESTQKLPDDIKSSYKHIQWRSIAGLRNILVHEYLEGVDIAIIKSIILNNLPPLKQVMIELLSNTKEE